MDSASIGPGSVSQLLDGLRHGDNESIRLLWSRYFQPMVRLARNRLLGHAGADAEAEDIALQAFWTLFTQLTAPDGASRFPRMSNRSHLWKVLACMTARQALDVVRKETRRRRVVEDETGLGESGLDAFAGREPPPEFHAAVGDLLAGLPSEELRRIALARMENCSTEEIALRLGRSLSTIERKLQVIRTLWADCVRDLA